MSGDAENSDDDNVVVIQVPDGLSDGREDTWPLKDPRFKYRMLDDTRWRMALAEMWIERTGAKEEGKWTDSIVHHCVYD